MNNTVTVLAVEDDTEHLNFLRETLELAGYTVVEASDGLEAKQQIRAQRPDLMLLDLGMPRVDGFQVLEWLRGFSNLPVIIITGSDGEDEKVRGLNLGADDFLVKPIGSRELKARVKAVLRRVHLPSGGGEARPPYRNGDLTIDFNSRQVYVAGELIHLTPIAYKLLCLFAKHTGEVLTHDELLSQVWGKSYQDHDVYLLRATVYRLRKNIERNPEGYTYIETIARVGYRFKAHPLRD